MNENSNTTSYKRNLLLVASGSVLLAVIGTLGVLSWAGWITPPQTTTQVMIHDMGDHVMPFELNRTTHIFEMTENGGIQQVIVDNPDDSEQIALIQQHLQHEMVLFSAGDFSDPSSLHSNEMPGVRELSAEAAKIKMEFTKLSNGAQITFTTQELHLITAIHRWFGAQLSDHGADATYR